MGGARSVEAHAAAALGEHDEVLGEERRAVVPAAALADRLPSTDNAALDVLRARRAE